LKLEKRDWNGTFKKKIEDAKKKEKEVKKEADDARVLNTTTSHLLSDYQGIFTNPVYADFEIILKNDALYAQLGTYLVKLKHYHYDVFKTESTDNLDIDLFFNFKTGNDGKIENISIPFEDGMKPFIFTSKPKAVAMSTDEMQKYVGDYDLTGITAKVYLKEKTLFLLVPGQPDYETIALGNGAFKLKALEGFSLKFEEKENKVISVNFVQPNGTFKAIKKG
jgi:hypothetical protein